MPQLPPELLADLRRLAPSQLARVGRIVGSLLDGVRYELNPASDFVTEGFAAAFGDELSIHHNGSARPMSKENFEYATVAAFTAIGRPASKFPNGNRGADIEVGGVLWSLKTQADGRIRPDALFISKFMELGSGPWDTLDDVAALRQGMFDHLGHYDRIFSLRCLSHRQRLDGVTDYYYELVEIPKALLMRAQGQPIVFSPRSSQSPRPAYCYVREPDGSLAFQLYFDAGGKRKLQVQQLAKRNCVDHATWSFTTAP